MPRPYLAHSGSTVVGGKFESLLIKPNCFLIHEKVTELKIQIKEFFFKWAIPSLFFVYFRSFQTNNTNLTTNQCEKMSCPSSIPHRDSNPQPSELESPSITTRPGLPPNRSNKVGVDKLAETCQSFFHLIVCSFTYIPS